jgi:hypothetical protein
MKMNKNRGMSRLRKDKRRLEAQIALEKVQLYAEVEHYTSSLWPVKVLNRFRKTAESLSESKLLVIGAQLLFSALNTSANKRRQDEDDEERVGGGIKGFLKSTLNNFLQQYMQKNETQQDEESTEEDR